MSENAVYFYNKIYQKKNDFDIFSIERYSFYIDSKLNNFDLISNFSIENKLFDTLTNIVKFIFDAIIKLCHFITNGFKILYNFIIFLFKQIKNKINFLNKIKSKSKENQEPYKKIENLTVKIHDWVDKQNLFKPFDIWRNQEVERLNAFVDRFEITEKEELEIIKHISKEIANNDLLFVDHSTIEYAYKDKDAKKKRRPYTSRLLRCLRSFGYRARRYKKKRYFIEKNQ